MRSYPDARIAGPKGGYTHREFSQLHVWHRNVWRRNYKR